MVDNRFCLPILSSIMRRDGRSILLAYILSFSCFGTAISAEKNFVDLGKIRATKHRPYPETIVTTYDRSALESSPYESMIQTLGLSALDLQSRAPASGVQSDLSLRGSTYQGVLMLMDGQRINDPQTAHHNSDLPFTGEDLERVDVIPGIAASTFGSDAIGGAVNLSVKKPLENKTTLELSGGENMTRSGLFSLSRKEERLGVRVSIEDKRSDGYRPDTDFGVLTGGAALLWDVPLGEFFSHFSYQDKEFGAYDFYTPASGYESKEWTRTYLSSTGFSMDKEGFVIKPNFLWRRHYDKFMLDKTLTRSLSVNYHHTDIYTPNIYFQKETDRFGKVGLGLEYGKEQIISSNIGKHERFHESIYVDDDLDINSVWSMGFSGRFDHYEGVSGNIFTGKAQLNCQLTEKNSIYGGVARSVRMPSFTELYYSDSTTVGNPDLMEEEAITCEIGHQYKEDTLQSRQTFFIRKEDNFIDWVKLSSSESKWRSRNINSADVLGLENSTEFKANEILSWEANYTCLNRQNDDSGAIYKYGTNYTKHILNNTLKFHFPFGSQTVGVTTKMKPGRRPWTLLNLGLSYQLNRESEIFIKVSNLLNVEYQEIAGIPQPGRWAEAGVRMEW